uniref:Family with sequence similarity 217 member B n=1 Tax=Amphilophus citrinellus TaxID=61819 RepID=A0A3Q0T0C3_AMPCI
MHTVYFCLPKRLQYMKRQSRLSSRTQPNLEPPFIVPAQPLTHSPAPTPEALQQHYNHKDDDTDSASDLSDSERLPVLPSPCTPCTPPHLNLRAEIINTNDFPPDFPGPHGAVGDEDENEKPSYSYPDFLPPPFNSWSLRQLAVFLHTEGRGAPRPKPVGTLEKYLERLLQLEWLQIQTVQVESSRPPGSRPRPQGFSSAATAHQPRPHTAPPSRLNSPKGLRHSQRYLYFRMYKLRLTALHMSLCIRMSITVKKKKKKKKAKQSQ